MIKNMYNAITNIYLLMSPPDCLFVHSALYDLWFVFLILIIIVNVIAIIVAIIIVIFFIN